MTLRLTQIMMINKMNTNNDDMTVTEYLALSIQAEPLPNRNRASAAAQPRH